jgi:general secretion pathway protein A
MMRDFAALDVGTLGREWWHRCQPQIGQAMAIGALFGLLVGGGLAVRNLSLDTLMLWSKYQIARAASGAGLWSAKITWPGERGEADTTVGELLQTPGLDAWAEPVSRQVIGAAAPALLSGFLTFLATLFWNAMRVAPDRIAAGSTEPAEAATGVSLVEAERPLPVILPHLQPPPDERPHQDLSAAPLVEAEQPFPVILPHLQPQSGERSDPVRPDSPSAPQETFAREPPRMPPPARPAARPSPAAAPTGKPAMSYEFYWGLAELPFENVPDPKFYYPDPMHEEALHRLLYGVQTRKGAVMLTGEIGSGKTLLSRELSLHLSGQQYDMAMIANPSFGAEDFLTEVLYQLGIEPTKTKVKLLHLLNDRLHENYKKGKQTLIVVDEAQAIPDNDVFEELRLLLNFQLNDRFLLTLVLMGQPELNDRVMALKQFAQRISIKYHLGAFSRGDTAQYIAFRLKAAQCQKELFTDDALSVIFERSGGIPRNINRLCDLCLLIGFMDRAPNVSRAIAERAAADIA